MDTMLMGRFGEERAADYLRRKGYTILGMNYRTRLGEIDVIASRGSYVVFVEVKLRRSAAFAQGREFVTIHKQRRVILAAESWLQAHPSALQPRFDVVEIYAPDGPDGALTIRHLENAFDAS